MINGWLARIEQELHDADSDHDKRDLAVAHTVLRAIIDRIEEYGQPVKGEPEVHVIDDRVDVDEDE